MRPSHAVLVVALSADLAAADCGTFKLVEYLGTSRTQDTFDEKVGIPLSKQRQQISKAITCEDPTKGGPYSTCGQVTACTLCASPEGNTYTHAVSNLTASNSDQVDARERIMKLALDQTDWEELTNSQHKYEMETSGRTDPLACACPEEHDSAIVQFNPKFGCVSGVLQDCGDDSVKPEVDGTPVTACFPYILNHRPQGVTGYFPVSNQYVVNHSENPSLKVNAATSLGPSTWRWTVAGIPLVASIVYLA